MKAPFEMTLKSMIDHSCEQFGNLPALSNVDDEPIRYSELREQIDGLIRMMEEEGIVKGDKIAILGQNMPNWGIAYLAITSMGAVVVPILTDFHVNEILNILRHSESKMVFVSRAHYDKIGYSDLEPWVSLVALDNFELLEYKAPKDRIGGIMYEPLKQLYKLRNKALKAVGLKSEKVNEDDTAALIYTSGTTGLSKGVMLSHKNLVLDAWITSQFQPVRPQDRLLSVLPLSHTYECTIGFIIPMMGGGCVYYLDKPPTARVLVPAMQKIRPTMILTVPLIIEKIFKTQVYPQLNANPVFRALYKMPPTRKLLHQLAGKKLMKTFGGELHFFGIGGALLSWDVERFLNEAGFPYAIGYGLTETSPLVAGSHPRDTRFRSTGQVLEHLQLRIADPDPKTRIGEIEVKGDTVMKGYYKDPARTAEAFTKDGFFKTGDLGILRKKRYLYIIGRSKNVIVAASGENIYPEEVESKLNEHEAVLESLVLDVGGVLTARVFLSPEYLEKHHHTNRITSAKYKKQVDALLDEIKSQANENLSSFSRIKHIVEQREPFEKTATQKIKRFLYQ
ncbi:MAG: AMP-binding protein [Candidatus Cloacimonadaceae bacterium]|jgi:long-chain acyl-CoA synthetase|nr:AMP-binding protein [Candidatus Cloacimonadota bacterium]MDX9950019.1 AMP-binding protein [Candidatus Syntrophosphaera sp.]NLN85647.1 long-chain fatty acid--CoA ligase [Candidatus Cloacimonadota bacterium]